VIAHGVCRFRNEAAVPIRGVEPVSDFDVLRYFRMMEETAIAENVRIIAKNNCKGRRQTSFAPREKSL
jgi:hypothetical protein